HHDSLITVHDSLLTVHDSRFTTHDSRLTIHDSRLTRSKKMAKTATPPAPTKKPARSGSAPIRPIHDKILVRRAEADAETAPGIILPEKAKDKPKTGIVEAVGTGTINTETGALIPLTVKKGDRIIFSSYAGTEVKLGPAGSEQELLVMSEDEVLAIIE